MNYKKVRQQIQAQTARHVVPTLTVQTDPKAWARRLKERHESGEKLSKMQISMYRQALRIKNETPTA